ncbi:MAG TPA: nucleoside monophosphate kinase [Candidatus Saccharimonadales bacterium]|nr:nucleoside monophosphate kinase [Candidatus Saccharimonadales bacterium]
MIILFGVVGSGKSEQAKRLIEKLHCPYISTSRLIREQQNPVWENLMAAGTLLSDTDVLGLLEPVLEKLDAAKSELILDGAPRSVGQAEWLINKIKAGRIKYTATFHLQVSQETTMQRLLARGREDDKVDIIAERFSQYESITRPVLDYLAQNGFKPYEIDGEWSTDVVERQIWKILEEKHGAAQVG